jgi:hypothetical protein
LDFQSFGSGKDRTLFNVLDNNSLSTLQCCPASPLGTGIAVPEIKNQLEKAK